MSEPIPVDGSGALKAERLRHLSGLLARSQPDTRPASTAKSPPCRMAFRRSPAQVWRPRPPWGQDLSDLFVRLPARSERPLTPQRAKCGTEKSSPVQQVLIDNPEVLLCGQTQCGQMRLWGGRRETRSSCIEECASHEAGRGQILAASIARRLPRPLIDASSQLATVPCTTSLFRCRTLCSANPRRFEAHAALERAGLSLSLTSVRFPMV